VTGVQTCALPISIADIEELARTVESAPEQRAAQRVLAEQVTELVHGREAVARAQRASAVLFDKNADYRQLSGQELAEAFHGAPTTALDRAALGSPAAELAGILEQVELYPSRGRARKDIPAGAISVNNVVVRDISYQLSAQDLLPGDFIILRKGKKTYHVLKVGPSQR
jgi:tyrosyl-tRNA synthetase